jgi:hypothetical protein
LEKIITLVLPGVHIYGGFLRVKKSSKRCTRGVIMQRLWQDENLKILNEVACGYVGGITNRNSRTITYEPQNFS